jgi:hypothetical protein
VPARLAGFLLKLTGHFSTGRKKRVKKRDCQPVALSHNETSAALTMPTGQNAKTPMNNDNVKFTECVRFTHHASNSRFNVIHWHLTPINASNSRITHKRTERARQRVFPSNGYLHSKTLSKRLETGFKRQQTLFTATDDKAKHKKTSVNDPR